VLLVPVAIAVQCRSERCPVRRDDDVRQHGGPHRLQRLTYMALLT